MLVLTILIPLLFAVIVLVRPPAAAKYWALGGTSVCFLLGAMLVGRFFSSPDPMQAMGSLEWMPALGLSLSVGVDSIAVLLIALALLLGPICVLASWTAIPESRARLFFGWLLVLQGAMVGVFAARDLLLFYTCFEFTLLPMFVLINEFGSTNRHKAATKFFLYTFTGSLIALAGLVYAAWAVATRGGARHRRPGLHARHRDADDVRRGGAHAPRAGPGDVRDARGLRGQGAALPVPHLAAPGPHRGAHGGLGAAGGRAAQAGHLRDVPVRAPVHARPRCTSTPRSSACWRSSASSTRA
jgi:hypothetical protein